MNPVELAIRQPVTVIVGVVLVVLAGLIALTRLPISLTPTVEDPVVTVTTFWEGATPEEIEQNIVDKQEERLIGLGDLELLTSTSQQGQGRVRLQFRTGTDIDSAMLEVSQKLDQVASYPDNVDRPVIEQSDWENRDYIAWVVLETTDPDFDIRTLRDFAIDRIEPALENVPGIAEINVLGGRERELQIRIDPVRMAQLGITPTQFAAVIRDTNQNLSAGQREDGKRDVRIRTVGQFASTHEIEETVIAYKAGGSVLVRDVAEVVMTYKEATGFVRSRGEAVIAINAERELDSNVMDVMDGLRDAIAVLNQRGGVLETEANRLGMNGELRLRKVYDQTVYIEDALRLVRSNIWIGGALATIVLLLFLRSLTTVGMIAVAIPISVIGAVVVMVALGRSINVISLAGMAFAVGMVVDNAIVVIENIFRHLEMGKSRRQAAYDGTREVWGAVLASTLTTLVVFVPILMIQEQAGQLFRDIALAICAAVAISLVVSITVIPTGAARVLRLPRARAKALAAKTHRNTLADVVAGFVDWACGRVSTRLAIIAILALASIIGTIWLIPPADYLPRGNRNLVFGLIIPPPGYNLGQYQSLAERIETTIGPFWEPGDIDDPAAREAAIAALPTVYDYGGRAVVPPTLENYFLVSFDGILFHGGVSDDPRRAVDLIPLFNHATRSEMVPGVIAFGFQVPLFQLGGSTGSAIKLQLAGPDLDAIVGAAGALYPTLGQTYGWGAVQPEPSNFAIPGPEIQVRPNLVRLSEIGLNLRDVGLLVQASGDGAIVDEYSLGGETVDLKVISADVIGRANLRPLEDLPIATPGGGIVTVGAVARLTRNAAPQEIARVGRQRSVSFQVTPPEGMPLEAVIGEIEGTIADMRQQGIIPPTVVTTMAGSASKLAEVKTALLGDGSFIGTLGSSLFLALLVVYLLMCVLFQSFIKPLVIMFSVPLATLGGFAALKLVYLWSDINPYMPVQMLDVLTMLGFVLLIGVVVNNAILIVHQTGNFLSGRAEVAGRNEPMTPRHAVTEAVRTRVRPIFMSTLTSIGGMLPLVLMPGSGSELYRGLGSVVVGGLLVATIFTLLLVPLLLSLILDVQAALAGRWAAPPATRPAAAGVVGATRR